MEALKHHRGKVVPLDAQHVDTDQIIPARFLKATERVGFGDNLFRDWRYNNDDSPKVDFVLNDTTYSGKILVGGKNFGSGSSREHAAWAIYDYGFRCVVSSFFADIFKGNAYNNGILPIELRQELIELMAASLKINPTHTIKVNIEEQTISMNAIGLSETFGIEPLKKELLLNDTTETEYLINMRQEIEGFEAAHAILNL